MPSSTKRFALTALISLFALLSLYHAFHAPPPQSSNPKHEHDHPTALSTISSPSSSEIDWSRFAYIQYATSLPYLCNSLMLFARLSSFSSRPARLLLYPSHYSLTDDSPEAQLLRLARDVYSVTLSPITPLVTKPGGSDHTWAESHTKLLAYNQTDYARLLHLDSDSTLLAHLDELFLLPSAPAAMPRSYWEPQSPHLKLSSQLLLLEPSLHEFSRIKNAIASAAPTDYDMEIMNTLYGNDALVLPHRIYDLYTREFTPQRDTGEKHERYFGGDGSAVWNPDEALRMAKFVHFSDWPLPKPWIKAAEGLVEQVAPKCEEGDGGVQSVGCREREIWLGLYGDFRKRRKEVCGLDLV